MKKLLVLTTLFCLSTTVNAQQMTDEEITAAVGRTLQKQLDYEQHQELSKAAAIDNWHKQFEMTEEEQQEFKKQYFQSQQPTKTKSSGFIKLLDVVESLL